MLLALDAYFFDSNCSFEQLDTNDRLGKLQFEATEAKK